jgi:hypothetical protein
VTLFVIGRLERRENSRDLILSAANPRSLDRADPGMIVTAAPQNRNISEVLGC